MLYDLPVGGKRLLQRAEGYRFTFKSGAVTFEDGKHTGACPGRSSEARNQHRADLVWRWP